MKQLSKVLDNIQEMSFESTPKHPVKKTRPQKRDSKSQMGLESRHRAQNMHIHYSIKNYYSRNSVTNEGATEERKALSSEAPGLRKQKSKFYSSETRKPEVDYEAESRSH